MGSEFRFEEEIKILNKNTKKTWEEKITLQVVVCSNFPELRLVSVDPMLTEEKIIRFDDWEQYGKFVDELVGVREFLSEIK